MNAYDKAHELARAIRDSEEFRILAERKKQIDGDPQAQKILDDFRRRQWELETRRIMGEEITEDDRASLQRLHEAIQLHTTLCEYMEVEYRFSVMYSDIHKILGEAVREVIGTPEGI